MLPQKKKGTFKVFFKHRTNQLYWISAILLGTMLLAFASWSVYLTISMVNKAFRGAIGPPPDGAVRFQLEAASDIYRLQAIIRSPNPSPSPQAP